MTVFRIEPVPRELAAALQQKIDTRTKPPGSLGRLEALALQAGLVQQTLSPVLNAPHLFVFAGDHGAARAGVSPYPQDVTWQMVHNFLAGGAAINVFAGLAGMQVTVVDAGVNHDFGDCAGLVSAKIAHGTENYLDGTPAMSAEQRRDALAVAASLVDKAARDGCNVVAFGEMGIGNTSSAALITHLLAPAALADCVGRGAGLDDAGLVRKLALLTGALEAYRGARDPMAVLAQFGGFEVAMMVGGMLAAAERRMLILVDGFIATAAALVAIREVPAVRDYCVFGHRSREAGHRVQLAALDAEPLLDLELRLGEGTGAALAYPLLRAAVAFLNDMASFESAGVSDRDG